MEDLNAKRINNSANSAVKRKDLNAKNTEKAQRTHEKNSAKLCVYLATSAVKKDVTTRKYDYEKITFE